MTTLREAAQMALEALGDARHHMSKSGAFTEIQIAAQEALRTALAEPVQEPVAYLVEYENGEKEVRFQPNGWGDKVTPLYTHPVPQPVELTDDDLEDIAIAARKGNLTDLRNAIERAHGIGGDA